MKFAEKLTAHLTPEWRKQYIDYDELKEFLYKSIQDIDRNEDWTEDIISHLDQCDVEFFELCQSALQKIDNFFAEKLAEATRKYASLSEELEDLLESENNKPPPFFAGSKLSLSWRHHDSMRRSFSEQSDPKSKENGTVRLKVSTAEFDEKQDNEDGLRHRRSRRSSVVDRKKDPKSMKKEKKKFRKLHDLKLAFSEFYLSLVLLQNYQTLNFTGFRKILKKHDKLFRRDNGLVWRQQHVEPAKFNTSREVDDLIAKVENEYTEKLEQGDRQRAMKRLRVPPLSERHNPRAVFRFGFFAGIFLVEALVIILACLFLRPLPTYYLPALRIFRATFLVIFFLCLFGMNTYGWRSSGVNNVLIFELNPRSHLDHFQLLEVSFFLATVWGCAVIYFLFSAVLQIPPYASPFALVLFMLLCLFNPLKFGYHEARRWLLRILSRIFRAPFVRVTFADFWLADQLNSLSFILPDFAFFICFYSSQISWRNGMAYVPLTDWKNATQVAMSTVPSCAQNSNYFVRDSCQCSGVLFGLQPFLSTLPAWFRFAQCLRRYRDMEVKKVNPHILNAGKYSTTFFVTATSIWFRFDASVSATIFLAIAYFAQSTYTYSWDILMDWGLMEYHSDNRLLRDELVYRYKAYYYGAIMEDLMLRFTWIIRLSVQLTHADKMDLVLTILAVVEVVRRFIWNFFRLENEHLNNCGEFRAVRDIFITPLPKRPPRTVSAQLFSTNYGVHNKHNTIFPRNNSAMVNEQTTKRRLSHHWGFASTVGPVTADASPAQAWGTAVNTPPSEPSKTWRILNRIGAVSLNKLQRHGQPNRQPHHHYQHHIMDNKELSEALRGSLGKSSITQAPCRAALDAGRMSPLYEQQVPQDTQDAQAHTVPHGHGDATRPALIVHDKRNSATARITQPLRPTNHSVSGQSNIVHEVMAMQRLRVPSVDPSSVTRSQSHNDLATCARNFNQPAPHVTADSSLDTGSSTDLDALSILRPTDTAITLLSHDRERVGGSSMSMNTYSLLVPGTLSSSNRERPKFSATSFSSLESPEIEEAENLCVERPTAVKQQPSTPFGSTQSLEAVQNERLTMRLIYPRVIRLDNDFATPDSVDEVDENAYS